MRKMWIQGLAAPALPPGSGRERQRMGDGQGYLLYDKLPTVPFAQCRAIPVRMSHTQNTITLFVTTVLWMRVLCLLAISQNCSKKQKL